MNPTIQSGLIETASPAAESDAPKAGTVFIVGAAGKGPTVPMTFERASDAYRVYGQGTLARDIELALLGAELGAQVSGNQVYGRVVALRTETGTKASVVLKDADGKPVMTIETVEASELGNSWRFYQTRNGYRIYDPTEEPGTFTDIPVDATGSTSSVVSTPTELAEAIRARFAGKLFVEIPQQSAHYEVTIDETTTGIGLVTTQTDTTVDFSGLDTSDMAALKSGPTTWVVSKSGNKSTPYFDEPGAAEAHTRILSKENEDARVYAITAGAPVELPAGASQVAVDRLADAKRVGLGQTNTLLNIRTTGAGASAPVTIAQAGMRGASKKSEGYFRVRKHYVGRFDPTQVSSAFVEAADYAARVRSAVHVNLAAAPEITIDGVVLAEDDVVLLSAQTNPAENGLYGVIDAGGGTLNLQLLEDAAGLGGQTIDVTAGTSAGKRYTSDGSTFSEVSADATIAFEFDAPEGIADDGGALSAAYAASIGLTEADAALVSSDRLGTHYDRLLRLEMRGMLSTSPIVEIPLRINGEAGEGVRATLSWTSGKATVHLSKTDFESAYGSAFDDGFVYVSYDSCIFDLVEKMNTTSLAPNASGYEYAVSGSTISFNKPLPHALVVRGLRITQYRIGSDVLIERTGAGNRITFIGSGNQPGEAGGPVGKMQVILGFEYNFEPNFPVIASSTGEAMKGGSSGAGADVQTQLEAARKALGAFKDQDYKILFISGLHADDVQTGYDAVTGLAKKEPIPLLEVLQEHQDRVARNGASGVVYAAVRPMAASTSTGRYTDEQKAARFRELVQADPSTPLRPATILASRSFPDLFVFDAPMAVALQGTTAISNGVAFFAGIRSALPNDRALYQIDLPEQIRPLYRYDLPDLYMPGVLADARINTWADRRGEIRLADERTAAGLVVDARGRRVPSSFQSGIALLAAKDFLQEATRQLRNLLGPMPSSGTDTLRGTTVAILRGVATRTVGVQDINIDDQRDIQIRATGGSALGMYIRAMLQVNGELRFIDIRVGTFTEASRSAASQQQVIPVIG